MIKGVIETKEGDHFNGLPSESFFVRALYGSDKVSVLCDVTDTYMKLGQPFKVDNGTMRGDPVPGQPKKLYVKYGLTGGALMRYDAMVAEREEKERGEKERGEREEKRVAAEERAKEAKRIADEEKEREEKDGVEREERGTIATLNEWKNKSPEEKRLEVASAGECVCIYICVRMCVCVYAYMCVCMCVCEYLYLDNEAVPPAECLFWACLDKEWSIT